MIPVALNEKIQFIKFEETGLVVENETTDSLLFKTLYANVLNLNNSEFAQAYSTNSSIIVSFRVVYSKFTRDLIFSTKNYRIKWRNIEYDILAVVPSKDLNYADIKAKAVL